MKLSTKKLFLISLIVGTSFSNCKATSPNNNNQQIDIAHNNNNNQQIDINSTIVSLIQSLKEANERASEEQKKRTNERFQEQEKRTNEMLQVQEKRTNEMLQVQKEFINQVLQKQEKRTNEMLQAQQKKYKRKKRNRKKRRAKQRKKYVDNELNRQEEAYIGYSKGVISVVLNVLISGTIYYFSPKNADPPAYVELVGTGVKVAVDAIDTSNKKTPKKLQQEAKELWLSSSDEDDSEDESNNNNFNIKKIRKYSEDDSKDTNNNNRA